MYTIGLTHASDFSRFFSRQIIHELELTEESTCLFLASIDEDDGKEQTSRLGELERMDSVTGEKPAEVWSVDEASCVRGFGD